MLIQSQPNIRQSQSREKTFNERQADTPDGRIPSKHGEINPANITETSKNLTESEPQEEAIHPRGGFVNRLTPQAAPNTLESFSRRVKIVPQCPSEGAAKSENMFMTPTLLLKRQRLGHTEIPVVTSSKHFQDQILNQQHNLTLSKKSPLVVLPKSPAVKKSQILSNHNYLTKASTCRSTQVHLYSHLSSGIKICSVLSN